ncbi:MAG: XRE family transcriptional regulator [Ruminococcus sp.]|nr:XRE family transcriptional regulator [Ruminococcus sp.]
MAVGEQIRRLRRMHHLSQRMLAEKIGVNEKKIGRWENEIAKMKIDDAIKLADYFKISLDELVEGKK